MLGRRFRRRSERDGCRRVDGDDVVESGGEDVVCGENNGGVEANGGAIFLETEESCLFGRIGGENVGRVGVAMMHDLDVAAVGEAGEAESGG